MFSSKTKHFQRTFYHYCHRHEEYNNVNQANSTFQYCGFKIYTQILTIKILKKAFVYKKIRDFSCSAILIFHVDRRLKLWFFGLFLFLLVSHTGWYQHWSRRNTRYIFKYTIYTSVIKRALWEWSVLWHYFTNKNYSFCNSNLNK